MVAAHKIVTHLTLMNRLNAPTKIHIKLTFQEKHEGHTCCEDNPLLADIMLTNETLNWEGDKRCCMSATGVRQLEEIEGLTSDDYSAISEKVLQKDNTRVSCKKLLNHFIFPSWLSSNRMISFMRSSQQLFTDTLQMYIVILQSVYN